MKTRKEIINEILKDKKLLYPTDRMIKNIVKHWDAGLEKVMEPHEATEEQKTFFTGYLFSAINMAIEDEKSSKEVIEEDWY